MLPVTTQKFSTVLYWLLVLQLCVISASIAAASILLAGVIALLVVWTVVERKNILPRNPLEYFIAAYIVIEFLTAIFSVNVPEALRNSKRLLLFAVMYGVLLSFDSEKKIRQAVFIIAAVVSLQSVFEIYTYIAMGEDRLHIFQIYMTTGGIKMILCLALIPYTIDPKTEGKERVLLSIIIIPIFIALLLTNTRSSWLGFIAGIFVVGMFEYRKLLLGLAVIIVAFFLFAPQHQVERAKSIVDMKQQSNFGRIHMWENGVKIWKDYPILGTGDIDLHVLYEQYKQPDDVEYGGHLHNNFVQLFVTLGSVGFVIVMALWWKIWNHEYAVFSRFQANHLIKNVALGSLAVFAGFVVNGFFEWNFGDHEIMVFVWFSVGIALAAGNLQKGVKA